MTKAVAYQAVPRLKDRGRDIDALIDNIEVFTGAKGDGLDAFVSYRRLIEEGFAEAIKVKIGNRTVTRITPPTTTPGVDKPTKPTGVVVSAGFTHVVMTWDKPSYNGHSYTEIYRSTVDDFGTAVVIERSAVNVANDTVGYNQSYYYWFSHVNVNSIPGPLNDTSGIFAQTAPNISYVIEQLSDELNETHLAITLRSRIDLIDTPVTGLIDSLTAEVANRQSDISILQGQIDSLVASTDVSIYYQPNEPVGSITENSRWFDTDDNNHPYIYINGVWEDARDQLIIAVQSTLTQEIIDRGDADDAQIARLDALELTVDDPVTGVVANNTAVSLLDARVTVNESTIVSHASDITSLQTTVFNPTTGVGANATAISALDTRVTSAEGTITSHTSSITALNNGLTAANDSITVNASAISGLDSRVTDNEGDISSALSSITSLQTDITNINSTANANASAISGLTASVAANDSAINANASDITALENTVNNPTTGVVANASAVSSLDTRVTSVESDVTAQATSITQLLTDVGDNTALLSIHASSLNGLEAQWDVKAQVNDLVGGIGLYNDGVTTYFMVNAGVFAVLDDTGDSVNPFFIQGGQTWINAALIQSAAIQVAQIEQLTVDDISGFNSTFVLSTIGTANIGRAYLTNTLQSDNYVANSSGLFFNFLTGYAEFQDIKARGDIEATTLKVDAAEIVETLHIADQAVTFAVSVYETTTFNVPQYSFSKVFGATINCTGAPISITASLELEGNDGDWRNLYIEIRKGASVLWASKLISIHAQSMIPFAVVFVDDPGAGEHTYDVYARSDGGTPYLDIESRCIILEETKK